MENSSEPIVKVNRPHISKFERFPKIFKETVRILKEVKSQHKSVKTALYSSKFRGQPFKKVYALTYNVLKHLPIIDKIIKEIDLLAKEPHINLEAAEIMIHEIAVKKNPLPGQSKPILAVKRHKEDIEKAFAEYQNDCVKTDIPSLPRYIRVHTLVTTVSEVIEWLKTQGYAQMILKDDASLSSFLEAVKNLKPGEFLQDFHFADVLVFSSSENLSYSLLYRNGHIFLQDKASCIPVHALAPPMNSKVLDCCAAPGMKTVHMACLMENSGEIIALDKDAKRFTALELTLKHGHVTNCKVFCKDFTEVDLTEEPYSSIEYILLDPSCSGSGMMSRLDTHTDDEFSKSAERIQKLAGFQIVMLKHALKFPNVKRIVYSTCSVTEEENEFVIKEALENYLGTFCVSEVFPEWPTRGLEKYNFGHLCLRSYPDSNLTNGFFVAVIDRIKESSELQREKMNKKGESSSLESATKKKGTDVTLFAKTECVEEKALEETMLKPKKKMHKTLCEKITPVLEEENLLIEVPVQNKHKHKKTKSKKRNYGDMVEEEYKRDTNEANNCENPVKTADISEEQAFKSFAETCETSESVEKRIKHKKHKQQKGVVQLEAINETCTENMSTLESVVTPVKVLEVVKHVKKKKKRSKQNENEIQQEMINEKCEAVLDVSDPKSSSVLTESCELPKSVKKHKKHKKKEVEISSSCEIQKTVHGKCSETTLETSNLENLALPRQPCELLDFVAKRKKHKKHMKRKETETSNYSEIEQEQDDTLKVSNTKRSSVRAESCEHSDSAKKHKKHFF